MVFIKLGHDLVTTVETTTGKGRLPLYPCQKAPSRRSGKLPHSEILETDINPETKAPPFYSTTPYSLYGAGVMIEDAQSCFGIVIDGHRWRPWHFLYIMDSDLESFFITFVQLVLPMLAMQVRDGSSGVEVVSPFLGE